MNFNVDPFVRFSAKSTYLINGKYVVARDCRIIYVISGFGSFESGEKNYLLAPNTLIFYPYDVPYRITSDKENGMLFYTVNFDFTQDYSNITTMVPKTVQNHRSDSVLRSMDEETGKTFSQVIYLPDALWAENNIRIIYNEGLQKSPGYAQVQSSHMKTVLINIYRKVISTAQNNTVCQQIKDWILKESTLNNEKLAGLMNYHPIYLNEVFKKNEGITLHQFIMQQRLIKAYELITTTQLSLNEIALTCGFSSQSHFSSVFKSAYHVSPGRLRQQT